VGPAEVAQINVINNLRVKYFKITPSDHYGFSQIVKQSAAIDYSTQEANKRRTVVAFAGCARLSEKSRASFQSMGVENGSTGSMAFLGRLFREL
jgi:hypothetical protein